MQTPAQKEHDWLHQMIGTWNMESECKMGENDAPIKTKAREVVKSLGGLWTCAEGEMLDTNEGVQSVMTLGYDPISKAFVGTFVASCMAYLWVYRGQLDSSGATLTLDTEGPSFSGEGLAKYQDIITIHSKDHRTLESQIQSADGSWTKFMLAHYRRQQ